QTRFTQPAILLHSLAVLVVLDRDLPLFDFAAGHSLGEYAALAVTGALSFEDAVRAVVKRADLMERACRQRPGTMAAIIGLDEAQIEQVCRKAAAAGVVVPANYNSDTQIAVSGTVAGVEAAMAQAKMAGAKRALMLEVGGAFHSPLMESARDGLQDYLNDIKINDPSCPVVPNVTATAVTRGEDIRRLLVAQITAPVKWAQTMSLLRESGVTTVLEIGPGKVLSGLAKRDMRPEKMVLLDTLADIDQFREVSVS
ncbi:MAG: ACP S-malonyltransferase, partial [candidate division Zixibacteria bacterium]|nr:ACP S-malonyltransferase [candidate division Zixibacteria bacterium]